MKADVVVVFINIGHYHLTRINAAHKSIATEGQSIVALQVTHNTLRHPWGNRSPSPVPIITLDAATPHVSMAGEVPTVPTAHVFAQLDDLSPKVVLIPGWSFHICQQCLAWCRKRRVPAVLMSESKFDDEPRWLLKEWLKRLLHVRHFKAAIVGGEAHREYAISLGLPPDAVFTGYDVVDNGYFERAGDAARVSESAIRRDNPQIPPRPYFLSVTRLVERKNIDGLIRGYANYVRFAGPTAWALVVCGDGPEMTTIRQLVQAEQLADRVKLLGFLSYDVLPSWYAMAECFVHSAHHEQWGLVVNEACASALPVIVGSKVGARYDLVGHGENGYLIDSRSVADIAAKLEQMAALPKDARAEMGRRSRARAGRLAPERFGAAVLAAIKVATGGKS